MRAVTRGFLLFFLCVTMRADAVEEAARALAKTVAARLDPNETARVTVRNLSSLGRAEAARAHAAFEQTIRKRVRNPVQIEITLTISENIKSYLLVADFKRGEERVVEIVPFQPQAAPAAARPAMILSKKLLWEQTTPILDLAMAGEQMLVLDTAGVTSYERRDGEWSPVESAGAPSSVRDPRGRMTLGETSLAVDLPGASCQGTWKPSLTLRCNSVAVFSAGRNTFEDPRPFFSEARIGTARLAAEPDGRTHIYNATGIYDAADTQSGALGIVEDWGSDIAMIPTCAGPRIAASGARDRESVDTVTLYDLIQAVPVRVSAPLEFAGPVMALWPSKDGAVVVTHNLATQIYEVHGLSADCSR